MISNTVNGKEASKARQKEVLDLVRELEIQNPPDDDLLTNPTKRSALVDGVWYLQYTSPSEIEEMSGNNDDVNNDSKVWKPSVNEDPKIETVQFKAKGSVSAAGINVDVSNKVPRQIFDLENGLFFNEVELDFGMVRVGGPFKLSEKAPNSKYNYELLVIQLLMRIKVPFSVFYHQEKILKNYFVLH